MKKQIGLLLCWHFSKPSRVSFVSVVFFFNAWVNAFIPEPPYSFSIKHKKGGRSGFVYGYHSCIFLLSSRPRSSFVSVAFDFNDSLSDVAPVSPMLLSVDVMRNEKSDCLLILFVCFLSFVFTKQIEFSECCVWFQWFAQWCCSIISDVAICWYKEKRKRVKCWWLSFVCLLSFAFTTQIEFGECCVWFQRITQWCCSCVSNLVYFVFNDKRVDF